MCIYMYIKDICVYNLTPRCRSRDIEPEPPSPSHEQLVFIVLHRTGGLPIANTHLCVGGI